MSDGVGAKRLELFTSKDTSPQVNAFSQQLLKDSCVRERFLEAPTEVLREHGIYVEEEIKLTDRDRALLTLVGDQRIGHMYASNDFVHLENYVLETYPSLVPDKGDPATSVAADFDVLIEVEAVAVAIVAVAAFAFGVVDKVNQVSFAQATRIETALNARITALEARLSAVEER